MAAPAEHKEVPLQSVKATVVASWPEGTFLENIALLPDAAFAISVHNQKKILHVSPNGDSLVLAETSESPAGMVVHQGDLFVVSGDPGKAPHQVLRVNVVSGEVTPWLVVLNTLFLNGFTLVTPGKAVTVDSLRGAVIEVDLQQRTSRELLQHELLTKCSEEPMLPGANGVKFYNESLWVTNTDRALILKIGLRDRKVSVVADALRGDDLAVAGNGTLYVTNHIHNTLIRLGPKGDRVAIAGPDQGMAGSTACLFAHGGLYVTTTGGIILPYQGVVQRAKLVRLEVKEEVSA